MNFNFLFHTSCWLILLTVTYSSSNDIDLTSLTLDKGFYILGPPVSDMFGFRVTGAGDINGDSVDDFLVSARQGITTGTSNPGVVYVIFGNKNGFSNIDLSTGLTITQGFKINGVNAGDSFGWSLSTSGDLNNDNIADIAIGAVLAPYSPIPVGFAGAAYVLFGKHNWAPSSIDIATVTPPSDGFKIEGSVYAGYVGQSLAIVKDINGDGVDDFVIGASGESSSSGIIYVVYGQRTGVPVIDLQLYPPSDLTISRGFRILGTAGSYLGISVSSGGDFNGDSINDLVIGASTLGATDFGRAYIIFGQKAGFSSDIDLTTNSFSPAQGILIKGTNIGDSLGVSVSNAGDFNGDGITDVIIGSYTASPNGRTSSGAAYVLFGSKTGLSNIDLAEGLRRTQGFKVGGSSTDSNLGLCVSRTGDINGDGIDDVMISAYTHITTETVTYVIFGRKTGITDIDLENGLEDTQGFRITYSGAQQLGNSVASAGDVNGDGKPDIVLGALAISSFPSGTIGKAFIVYGFSFPGLALIAPIAQVQGPAIQVARVFALILSIINFSDTGAILFTVLADLLHYMKYLSISYPPRLQYILDQPDPEFISIPYLSSAPQDVQDIATDYVLPENFEKYGVDSSFMVNCWSTIITLAIIIGAIIFAYIGVLITSGCKLIHTVFKKLKEALKWNYMLAIFTGYFGDIAFNTAFQLWVPRFNTALDRTSLSLCILLNLAVAGVSVRVLMILYKIVKQYKQTKQNNNSKLLEQLKEEYKDYQVVFEGFKSNTLFHQSYLLIFNVRLYFFNAIVAYLFEHPLTQAVVINIQGLIFFAYLSLMRPIKETKEFIGSVSQEFILLIVHICVLCLAIIDNMGLSDSSLKIVAGDIIIVCNVVFVIVGLTYILVSMVYLIRDIINVIRGKSRHNTKLKDARNLTIISRKNGAGLTGTSEHRFMDKKKHSDKSHNISSYSASDETKQNIHSIDLQNEPSISLDNKAILETNATHEKRRKIKRGYLKLEPLQRKTKNRVSSRSKKQKK